MLGLERGGPARRRPPPTRSAERARGRPDVLAMLAMAVLIVGGLLNLHALDGTSLVQHQLVVVAVGVLMFLLLRRFRAASLRWLGWSCYLLSIVLLLAVDVVGVTSYGARRWLDLGSFTLQPSELAKLGLLLVLADVLGSNRSWLRRLTLALLIAAVPIGLVVTEPDLSTATVLLALTLVMLVLGRIPIRVIVGLAGAVAVAAPFAERLLQPYQLDRLHAFLNGSRSSSGPGWTILQAHIGLAWGGLTGQSRQPMHLLLADYLPERETDLAFASLVEQWGILAGVLAVVAAAVLVWRIAVASRHARTAGAGLAAAGFGALIGIEVVVSVAANLGLVPTAGVPFPLLSYGGTAAAVHIAALGLVLGVRAEADRQRLWLPLPGRRSYPRLIRLTAVAVGGGLIAMTGFAWHLQRTSGASLREAGLTQMTRCVSVPAPRGVITDRHGVALAVNVAQYQVRIVPALLSGRARDSLAALIATSPGYLDSLIKASRSSITVDVATLPAATAARVDAAHLAGVVVVQSSRRYYPYGSLLGPLLGWTGVATAADVARWPGLPSGEIVGRAGLEQTYDPILRGQDGQECVYVDPSGRPVAMAPSTAPVPGASLRLSIDLGLQQRLTAALASGMAEPPAGDMGGATVIDPRNGQVLAMASLPAYDDNVFGPPVNGQALGQLDSAPGSPMLEHVTQAVAPPGSTFKLVVASADMTHQVLAPDQVITTGGAWTLDGHVFHNWSDLPPQDLPQAIAWSNDVYFYQLAWALGPDAIASTARELGVGQPTGIDLPDESSGFLGTPSSVPGIGATWYPGSTALLGIGQGYLDVTPLQDAIWTSAVATGSVVTPRLGLAFGPAAHSGSATFTDLSTAAPRRLPFAAELGPVRAGMRAAVTGGTAGPLSSLPAPAGGKTGTAEDPGAPSGNDSWLSAVAPFDPGTGATPTIEVTAYIHGGDGHASATDVVRAAMSYYFSHEKAIVATPPANRS